MAPAETVEENFIFIPNEWIQSELEPAFTGTYDVTVWLPQDSVEPKQLVSAKTPITVHGTDVRILINDEAERIAANHPEVKKWMEQHSGDSIAKEENGEYFILWHDGWLKTIKEEHDRLKDGIFEDERSVVYKQRTWTVDYYSKLGQAPNGIRVEMNGISGAITSVNTFDR